MLGETQNQFSLTRAAFSTCGRQKTNFLSVAKLNNYVFVGSRRGEERWLYDGEALLYLRLNQMEPAGAGSFEVKVKVRGQPVALSRFLAVDCVTRDKGDRDRAIDGIGGLHRDGTRWYLPLEDALSAQNNGVVFFVKPAKAPAVEIVIRTRKKKLYLATEPDAIRGNNLLWRGFPTCPVLPRGG